MTAATEAPPAVGGLRPWERLDWIAADGNDLPEPLRALWEAHHSAAQLFLGDVESARQATEAVTAEQREWRRAVRAAVAAGKATPKAPATEATQAKADLAREDAVEAREALALVALEVLAALRNDPEAFEPYRAGASAELRAAVMSGPEAASEELKARLAALAGSIVNLSDPVEAKAEEEAQNASA